MMDSFHFLDFHVALEDFYLLSSFLFSELKNLLMGSIDIAKREHMNLFEERRIGMREKGGKRDSQDTHRQACCEISKYQE